MIYRSRRP